MPSKVRDGAPRSSSDALDQPAAEGAAGSSHRRAFVVVGMHRSGTSAMARVLALSGALLPADLMAPQPDNPTGFWEPRELVDLNDQFLASIDSAWDDIFGYDARSTAGLLNEHNLEVIIAALTRNYGQGPAIVLKDPRISLLIPLWNAALHRAGFQPVYVIMVRNPLEVAESLLRRNGFAYGKSLMLWASYMLAVERDTRGAARVFVDYDLLLARPLSALDWIEQSTDARVPRRSKLAANAIEQFVDADMRHHRFDRNVLLQRNDVWDVVRILYDWVADATRTDRGSSAPSLSSEPLDRMGQRMDDVFAAVGGVVADLRAQLDDVRVRLASAEQTHTVSSSEFEAAHAAWQADRQALLVQTSAIQEERERALAEVRRLDGELADVKEHWEADRVRLEAEVRRVEGIARERNAAVEAEQAEKRVLSDQLEAARDEWALSEVRWRHEGKERDIALAAYQAALDASYRARASLEGTVALQRSHLDAACAEHARLEAVVAQLRQAADVSAGENAERLTSLERDHQSQLARAHEQWRVDSTAIADQMSQQLRALEHDCLEHQAASERWRMESAAVTKRLESTALALEAISLDRDRLQQALSVAELAHRDIEIQVRKLQQTESQSVATRTGLERDLRDAKSQLDLVLRSRSWSLTKPLRAAVRFAKALRN